MNMKKIMAGVVASVMAVSTMAVAAFAEETYDSVYTLTCTADKINTAEEGFYANAMTGAIANGLKFEGTYSTADGATGNILFYPSWDGTGDEGDGAITINATDMWQGVTLKLPDDVAALDLSTVTLNFTITALDINADAQAQIDSYGEEGNNHVISDMVVAKIGVNTPFADGYGSILVTGKTDDAAAGNEGDNGANEGDGDATQAPADNGDTSAPTADKNTPDTGVEGVAVVAGLAIVAAGAVVVAKKRK